MDIKTVEQQVTTIRFFDDEVRHYINHPSDLVAALTRATGIVASPIGLDITPVPHIAKSKKTVRKQVKGVHKAKRANWATDGYTGHDSRPTSKGKVKCEGCGEFYSPQGMGPHHRNCPPWQLKQVASKAQAAA